MVFDHNVGPHLDFPGGNSSLLKKSIISFSELDIELLFSGTYGYCNRQGKKFRDNFNIIIQEHFPLHLIIFTAGGLFVMGNEVNKVIYSMIGVSKIYDKKPVLKDIYLSYFYGAKIGVLGLNGSGKSSLLKILAGVDKDFSGTGHSFCRIYRRLSGTGTETG